MNILILSDDMSFSNSLKNLSVFSKINDSFKSIKSVKKLKMALFSKNEISKNDIIFLDLDFLKEDMESIIIDLETYHSELKIIAFTFYDQIILKNINKSIFKRVFKKDEDYSEVIKYLSSQFNLKINISDSSINKYETLNFLHKIGFSYNHIGTKYILDSIYVARENNYYKLKQIYECVSNTNNVPNKVVSWNVNYAIEQAIKNVTEKGMQRYLNIRDNRKPTAKSIIFYVVNM